MNPQRPSCVAEASPGGDHSETDHQAATIEISQRIVVNVRLQFDVAEMGYSRINGSGKCARNRHSTGDRLLGQRRIVSRRGSCVVSHGGCVVSHRRVVSIY